ncbi:hypothetical protein FACS1894216_11720 [Synergistales bacterium]|nr:hypothetical protein FACS1894216_11720 [Synergistales bacterium]
MNVQETETEERIPDRESIRDIICILSEERLRRLAPLIEELIEEQYDEEDIAYIEAHKDEVKIPLEEVIAKFEAKYGSLDQYRDH